MSFERMSISRTIKGKSIIVDLNDFLCGKSFRASISQSPATAIEQKIERFLAASAIECSRVSKNYVTELRGSKYNAIIFGSGEAYTSTNKFDELAGDFSPEEIQASRPLGEYSKGWTMRFSDSDIESIKGIIKKCCNQTTIDSLLENPAYTSRK